MVWLTRVLVSADISWRQGFPENLERCGFKPNLFGTSLGVVGAHEKINEWPLVLQALQIESLAGHSSFRKTFTLIQSLLFLGLSFLNQKEMHCICYGCYLTCFVGRQKQQLCLFEKKINLLGMKKLHQLEHAAQASRELDLWYTEDSYEPHKTLYYL